MDWAENAANNLIENSLAEYGATALEIAAALRKAKADGMRLAAPYAGQEQSTDELLLWADKIEKGEPDIRASAIEKGTE